MGRLSKTDLISENIVVSRTTMAQVQYIDATMGLGFNVAREFDSICPAKHGC